MHRNEYPRPQFVRENWMNLNGQWLFAFDDKDEGIAEKWYTRSEVYDQKINVPFVYQSASSGIGDRSVHDVVWYQKKFQLKAKENQHVLLHFGAVDYEADIYVNQQHVFHHIGGHTAFEVDITDFLWALDQSVTVRAKDAHRDESIPRGKQFWEAESAGIWYTNSTGIWQTVWLEVVDQAYLQSVRFTPDFDQGKINCEIQTGKVFPQSCLTYEISFKGQAVAAGTLDFVVPKLEFSVELFHDHIFRMNYHNEGWSWTPETPNLFDVKLQLKVADQVKDEVTSYFGMRKVHQEKGMVYLNNKPYYQKLVLDQGYWPEGLLTAPEDEDFVADIQAAKDMGFNGCRKHQKMEDPRFLYWADHLGFVVWGECAAPPVYTSHSVERLMAEWTEVISRDYNHPSILTWVPINESWGVPKISFDRQQQHFSQAIFHYLHCLDTTRLVISNDGWAQTDTDIVAIHNYQHGQKDETEKYAYFCESVKDKEHLLHNLSTPWPIFAQGFSYQDQPILLTEFGGIGYDVSGQPGWGYTSVNDQEELVSEYGRVMAALYQSRSLWGYCYTQLTDVEQEINGLLTYDRRPKCPPEKIREINDGFHLPTV